jgi:thiazole synthase ThiGH ThiG subunit
MTDNLAMVSRSAYGTTAVTDGKADPAGPVPRRMYADASSPMSGLI